MGEPDLLIAQIYFRQGSYAPAAAHAQRAVERMYALAAAWDKRRSYSVWVGYGRLLALRADRKLRGLHSMPTESADHLPTSHGLPLVSVCSHLCPVDADAALV